jgi:hypothetical protein
MRQSRHCLRPAASRLPHSCAALWGSRVVGLGDPASLIHWHHFSSFSAVPPHLSDHTMALTETRPLLSAHDSALQAADQGELAGIALASPPPRKQRLVSLDGIRGSPTPSTSLTCRASPPITHGACKGDVGAWATPAHHLPSIEAVHIPLPPSQSTDLVCGWRIR